MNLAYSRLLATISLILILLTTCAIKQVNARNDVQQEARATMAIDALVSSEMAAEKVVIFSKSYCPFCLNSKRLFKELGVNFHVIELDQDGRGREIQDHLFSITKQRTVPNIFINGKHIGGFDKTRELKESGELRKLLGLKPHDHEL